MDESSTTSDSQTTSQLWQKTRMTSKDQQNRRGEFNDGHEGQHRKDRNTTYWTGKDQSIHPNRDE